MERSDVTILVISTSLRQRSSSRILANEAYRNLSERPGVRAQLIDLAEHDIKPYPRSEDDPLIGWIRNQFEEADGHVLAGPVYNWNSGSALPDLLHYVLNAESGRRYRPFLLLGAAGSSASRLRSTA